ncbi:putative WavS protein [Caloramator australicus RC3]|uniref:Putative WavS protein n=2 Tax=Caloramator TaxID=44258 RepID=G0V440_9CLOT|nr:putative WavS protein [Caloramator australicus RC3]
MLQNKFEFKILEWDTNYFGIKSARVTLKEEINRNDWIKIRNFIVENDFVVIDNINNNPTNNLFISNLLGAFLTDINFQFEKKLNKELNKFYNFDEKIVIKNNLEYKKDIVDISRKSYKFSRFFNDPFLNKEKAKNIYCHWVESSFLKDDKYFLYYLENNEILGYILFKLDELNKKAIIELISVKVNHIGMNIGTKMINELEKYLITHHKYIDILQVGTQSNNTKAINFYVKNGFKVKELRSVYHYWPNFILNNIERVVNDEVAITNK